MCGISRMSLMMVKEVVVYLGVKEVCVERLECESLLVLKEKDIDGNFFFDSGDVDCYK